MKVTSKYLALNHPSWSHPHPNSMLARAMIYGGHGEIQRLNQKRNAYTASTKYREDQLQSLDGIGKSGKGAAIVRSARKL